MLGINSETEHTREIDYTHPLKKTSNFFQNRLKKLTAPFENTFRVICCFRDALYVFQCYVCPKNKCTYFVVMGFLPTELASLSIPIFLLIHIMTCRVSPKTPNEIRDLLIC